MALGISGKFAAGRSAVDFAPSERYAVFTADQFALRSFASGLVPGHGVARCGRALIPGHDGVVVHYLPESDHGAVRGVVMCKSSWACPYCASVISERRRLQLSELLRSADALSVRVCMVTLTFSHHAGQSLAKLLDQLHCALRRMTGHRRYRELRRRYGVLGWVRCLEVTYSGMNGWHPHCHLLLFLPGDVDAGQFCEGMRFEWFEALSAVGLWCDEHGFVWSDASGSAAEYVAKYGREQRWGVTRELTKAVVKRGRLDHLSPFDLLRGAAGGDAAAGVLFREFVVATAGQSQVRCSPGLSDVLLAGGLSVDDAAAFDAAEAVSVPLVWVPRVYWSVFVRGGPQALAALHVSARLGVSAVLLVLASFGVPSSVCRVLCPS